MLPGILGFIEGTQQTSVPQLKPGSTVTFTVKSQNSDGSWTLMLGGKELSVRSETALVPGERMRASVSLQGGRIYLRLLETEKLARHALSNLSLPLTEEHKNVVAAMIKTGLPLKEELIARLVQQYRSLSGQDTFSARVLALLSDKELLFSLEDVERLIRSLTGAMEREGREGRRDSRRQHGRGESGDRREDEKRRKRPTSSDMRAAVERSGGEEDVLALFNHMRGRHDNWIVVPFVPEASGDTAVLRFRIDGSDTISRFTFSLYGSESWHFEGKLSGKTPRLVIYCSDRRVRAESARVVDSLRKKLHNLAYEIDDTIRETAEFEPFVSETSTDVRGVDTRV